MSLLKFFVYGTLKPGYLNYQKYCSGKVISETPAVVLGELFHLVWGYPALTDGTQRIHGFLLSFQDPDILPALDALEGFVADRSPELNEYQRCQRSVFSCDDRPFGVAWVYQMSRDRIRAYHGTALPQGYWPPAPDTRWRAMPDDGITGPCPPA